MLFAENVIKHDEAETSSDDNRLETVKGEKCSSLLV